MVDEGRREEYFAALARELNRRPQNASLDPDTLTIIPGQKGLELEQRASWERLEAEVKNFQPGQVPLVVREVEPATTRADILALGEPRILGQAVTIFDPREGNRTGNIQVAAAALDGTLIEPGPCFPSTTLWTAGAGIWFLEAPELVNLELVPGFGGGVPGFLHPLSCRPSGRYGCCGTPLPFPARSLYTHGTGCYRSL